MAFPPSVPSLCFPQAILYLETLHNAVYGPRPILDDITLRSSSRLRDTESVLQRSPIATTLLLQITRLAEKGPVSHCAETSAAPDHLRNLLSYSSINTPSPLPQSTWEGERLRSRRSRTTGTALCEYSLCALTCCPIASILGCATGFMYSHHCAVVQDNFNPIDILLPAFN